MFGLGQEIRRPSTQELIRDRQIRKGTVLSRRKSVEQVARDELERLVLPDIHKTSLNDTRYEQTRTKGYIRRGYTFDLSKLKADKFNSLAFDEEDVEQLLCLKSLNSFNSDENHENYFGKYWKPGKCLEEGEGKREPVSRSDNDSEFSDLSANQEESSNLEKQHKDRNFNDKSIKYDRGSTRGNITEQRRSSFPDVPSRVDVPSRLVVRKAVRVDIGAPMCTQSMNSLSTELAMFKDAFSKELRDTKIDGTKTPHWLLKYPCDKDKSLVSHVHVAHDTRLLNESNTRSSPTRTESSISAAADSSVAVFKKKRKNLLSRSQKSRESRSSSESSSSLPKDLPVSPTPSQTSATEIITDETSCRKKSFASEAVDGRCACVHPPRVEVSLKDDLKTSKTLLKNSKKKEVLMPTRYYECYTPVTSKLVQFSPTKDADRAPFKIDSKVTTMQRALAEFKERKPPKIFQKPQLRGKDQSPVFSDPEISKRRKTPVRITSHEWPPQMKLSDDEDDERPSLSGNGGTLRSVDSKCDEWLKRWISEGSHGDDTQ